MCKLSFDCPGATFFQWLSEQLKSGNLKKQQLGVDLSTKLLRIL